MVINFRDLGHTAKILLKIQESMSKSQPEEYPGCGLGRRPNAWEHQPAGGLACPRLQLSVPAPNAPASLFWPQASVWAVLAAK